MSAADRGAVFLALLIGAAVLAFRIGWQDYWWDEEVTLMLTLSDWRELLLDYWALDTHRPVYYALQKAWNAVAGDSIAATRALPAVVMLLTVPVFFRIAREIEAMPGRGFAAMTAVLLATSPVFAYQGRELRMYCLLNLCLALALLFAIRIARRVRAGDAAGMAAVLGFSVSLAAAFYAHAIAVFVALMFGVWVLVAVALGLLPLRVLRSTAVAAGLWLLFILPALLPFLTHFGGTIGGSFWLPEPTMRYVYDQTLKVYPYPKWFKPAVVLLLLWGFWSLRRQPLWALLLGLLVIGLPASVLLFSFYKPIFMGKVIAFGSLAAVLVLGTGLAALRPAFRGVGFCLMLAAHAGALAKFYPAVPEVSPYAAFASDLNGFDPEQDILVLGNQLVEPGLRWHYPQLFEGEAYAFLYGDNTRNVIDPAFRSTYVPRAEASTIPIGGGRLFVFRQVEPHEAVLEAALDRVVVGLQPNRTVEVGNYRLDVYLPEQLSD